MGFRFPGIREVASRLRLINESAEGETDVRLCIWDDGTWCLNTGDVQYDTAHATYCEAGMVPGVIDGKVQRFDARQLAKELLDGCQEQRATEEIEP
jgi:hypothetical protein